MYWYNVWLLRNAKILTTLPWTLSCNDTNGASIFVFLLAAIALEHALRPFIASTAPTKSPQWFWPHSRDCCHSLMLTCRNTSCWQSCECCNTFLSSLWQPLLALTRSTEHGRHVACALLGTSRNTSLARLASSSGTSSCHSYNYIWSRATCT